MPMGFFFLITGYNLLIGHKIYWKSHNSGFKIEIATITTFSQHYTGDPSYQNKAKKKKSKENINYGKEQIKLSIFSGNVTE